MAEHREAYLVSNLFGVMDHADLDFEGLRGKTKEEVPN